MRNIFLVLISSIFMVACGSDAQEDESITGLSKYKGLENEPILTVIQNPEYDSPVHINSIIKGYVLEGGENRYYFEPYDSELVTFIIDKVSEEVAFEVKNVEDGASASFSGFYSSHIKVVDVSAGERYLISVSSNASFGDFNLKIVQANRESLSLLKDDYLVKENFTDYQECNGEINVIERDHFSLFNFEVNGGARIPIGSEGVWYATKLFDNNQYGGVNITSEYWVEVNKEGGSLIGGGDYFIQFFGEDNILLRDESCEGYIETVGVVVL